MSHRYSNIDQTKDDIRVVEILPELSNGIINCRLHHVALSSTHVCLSYTWGSSQKPQQVLINGNTVAIGNNLYQFLGAVRLSRVHELIWNDAICINQDNADERNHQVQLMGRIYGDAKQVLIWLVGESSECEDLLHLIGREDRSTSTCLPCARARLKINELQSHPVDRIETSFRAMNHICRLAYWNRTWTLQEFVLARKMRLMYSSTEADIEDFEIFFAEWTKSGYSYPPRHMQTIGSFERVKAYCEERLRHRQSRHSRVSLPSLLYAFHGNMCPDQQDRIYAMPSLVKGGNEFQIDYREPAIELLFRTIYFCKPRTLQELARLSSTLISTFILEPAEQQLVQDFVVHARNSPNLKASVVNLPASAVKVCFLANDNVSQDLTDDVNTL